MAKSLWETLSPLIKDTDTTLIKVKRDKTQEEVAFKFCSHTLKVSYNGETDVCVIQNLDSNNMLEGPLSLVPIILNGLSRNIGAEIKSISKKEETNERLGR